MCKEECWMMSFASWSHVAPFHHQCSSSHKSMAYHLLAILVTICWLVHTTDILKNIQKLRALTEKLRFDTSFFQARYLWRGATGVQPTGEGLGQEGVGPSPFFRFWNSLIFVLFLDLLLIFQEWISDGESNTTICSSILDILQEPVFSRLALDRRPWANNTDVFPYWNELEKTRLPKNHWVVLKS